MLDYDNISSRAVPGATHTARLSDFMRVLLLDYVARVTRTDWQQPQADTNSDHIMAELAAGAEALMTNYAVGQIVFGSWASPPPGMLLCDGSEYNAVDYPQLYAAVGVNYLIDENTFRVPNLIDRFPRGADEPGMGGGSDSHTLTESEIPLHYHTTGNTLTGLAFAPGELPVLTPNPLPGWTGGTGGGLSHPNIPRYETVLPCIIAF